MIDGPGSTQSFPALQTTSLSQVEHTIIKASHLCAVMNLYFCYSVHFIYS